MEKKNVVLLTVIAVATLLITVVGATFAYYAATIDNSKNENINIKASANLAITYNDGSAISVSNIIPGWNTEVDDPKGSKTITITNNSDLTLKYKINWYDVQNSFTNDLEHLKYNLKASSDQEEGTDFTAINKDYTAPTDANTPLVKDIEIKPNEVHTYVIKFRYENSADIQDTQGASFSAQFTMADSDVQAVYTPTE